MFNTALKVLKKIEDKGYQAYIVGGYVRDLYLNKESIDVDICTNATPKELKEIFTKVMLPNVQYGSITVIFNKIRFEITTYRKEIKYENNRLPVEIKYINDLSSDIKRRDFTINTLCMDSSGNILDLLNGRKDLDNNIIKTVGNPKHKLKEDSLRILRAIRFATILNFELERDLKKYIKKYGYLLKKLSYQRKKEELEKIFSSPNVRYGLSLIKELGLDKHLEISNIDSVVVTSSIIGIWAQLDVLDIYQFNNNEKEIITKINELYDKDILDYSNLYNYGLYITTIVGEVKKIDRKIITKKYNELYINSRKDIDINCNDICRILNKKPGPFLKVIFKDLENKLVEKKIENEKRLLSKYILENYNN
jgi:tRNA nucleotidyltransferase/poly(A) polymerase